MMKCEERPLADRLTISTRCETATTCLSRLSRARRLKLSHYPLKGTYQLTLNLSRQDVHAVVQSAGVIPPDPWDARRPGIGCLGLPEYPANGAEDAQSAHGDAR